ncbi:MAG: hypothetical protein V1778_00465 [bacterium]
MEKGPSIVGSHPGIKKTADFLDEQTIGRYWRLGAWPVVIALLVLFFCLTTAEEFSLWREWIVKGVAFCILAYRARQAFGDQVTPVLYASVLAGLLLGLGSAILRLVQHFAFYRLFTLLTAPAETILLGLAVSWAVYALFKKFGTLPVLRLLPERQSK